MFGNEVGDWLKDGQDRHPQDPEDGDTAQTEADELVAAKLRDLGAEILKEPVPDRLLEALTAGGYRPTTG
ncbi:hypothetical protein [Caenispirillum salinarum]|uniref:hypothetical protein n=1 Tax=Caenispirillum salinarum TaxID=859058 RepID=UPI0012670D4B|nr:hypothetical protein [Caenispirillum salinarum]